MANVEEHEKQDNENYSRNFTRTPNIVFASYKYLTKEEKYLYTLLRFIYWDTKPRYASLRELHEQTEFSIGALSKMLPRLHTCGLIHAEIRRERVKGGQEKGNPKYHITILDIWELNKLYFSCSPNEQEAMDPSLKLVHEMTQACSPNDTGSFTKCDKPVHEKRQGRAQPELAKKDIKITKKIPLKKEKITSVSKTETDTPSLSEITSFFVAFDNFYRNKDNYPEHFMVPRDKKNTDAIKSLLQAGATIEQALFVFEDIWNDADAFWKKNRSISSVASQYAIRIANMNQGKLQNSKHDKPSVISVNNQKNIDALLAKSRQKVEV